ncbi:translation initiation factor IF-2-like isoform X3 [Prionailurus viverrinus]|uniref:translation initiation factor IF-2-like isoform X3 n=1 Tax=Prionailurus viverrinus TaxID=61388 RepID=UPI001FF27AA9|nr:translation initiation factor IF-2-like isoform X3 [Prionailurus viverrinus]
MAKTLQKISSKSDLLKSHQGVLKSLSKSTREKAAGERGKTVRSQARPAPRWGTRGVSPSAGAPRRHRWREVAGPDPRWDRAALSPSPPHYLRAAVPGPGGLVLLLLLPARLRRRGGGGGGGDSPGGGGGARGSLPLSSPGRLRGPYLGPPRLGPWTACGWGMAVQPAACLRGLRPLESDLL